MSIRIIACVLICVFFCIYAWRNVFASACASVGLMAIMQHPDVIADLKSIGGIQGLNLWNILIANVVLAWLSQRRTLGFVWDIPRNIVVLLTLYLLIVVWSAVRLLMNLPVGYTVADVVSEDVINCLKWVIPAIVLFDTCRTRRRIIIAACAVLGVYLLLAVQVIKHVPFSYAVSDEFQKTAYKLVQNSVGYNRVTLSAMLGGACWAILATLVLAQNRKQKILILGSAGLTALGQALTGGRSGYVSWAVVGLILCLIKWRKLLPLIPLGVIAVFTFLPGVRERILQGVGLGEAATDAYEATSGRNIAWPYVVEKIKESPLIGYGCEAMISTGIHYRILDETDGGENFAHPHNAYLQTLLDTGLIGFVIIVPFYLAILKRAFSLLLDRSDPLFEAVGGICCAVVLSLLVASMGGQTFYPREGAVGLWVAMFLMLRVWVERQKAYWTGISIFEEEEVVEDTLNGENEPVLAV